MATRFFFAAQGKGTKGECIEGFTLIEVLLYVAIVSSVILAVVGVYSAVVSSRERDRAAAEVDATGADVAGYIGQLVRNGESIEVPSPGQSGNGLTVGMFDTADDPTTIILEEGSVIIDQGGSGSSALSSDRVIVTDLSFENVEDGGSTMVRYFFGVSHTNPDNRPEYSVDRTFSGSVVLRSYNPVQ